MAKGEPKAVIQTGSTACIAMALKVLVQITEAEIPGAKNFLKNKFLLRIMDIPDYSNFEDCPRKAESSGIFARKSDAFRRGYEFFDDRRKITAIPAVSPRAATYRRCREC
jgi:hypothetical protein